MKTIVFTTDLGVSSLGSLYCGDSVVMEMADVGWRGDGMSAAERVHTEMGTILWVRGEDGYELLTPCHPPLVMSGIAQLSGKCQGDY